MNTTGPIRKQQGAPFRRELTPVSFLERAGTVHADRVVVIDGPRSSTWAEVPKAFISLKPGSTASEKEIIAYVRERVAHFKAPKMVEFGELPKTSTGKIQKFALRDREWSGRT